MDLPFSRVLSGVLVIRDIIKTCKKCIEEAINSDILLDSSYLNELVENSYSKHPQIFPKDQWHSIRDVIISKFKVALSEIQTYLKCKELVNLLPYTDTRTIIATYECGRKHPNNVYTIKNVLANYMNDLYI